jgi:hypothetical protein
MGVDTLVHVRPTYFTYDLYYVEEVWIGARVEEGFRPVPLQTQNMIADVCLCSKL